MTRCGTERNADINAVTVAVIHAGEDVALAGRNRKAGGNLLIAHQIFVAQPLLNGLPRFSGLKPFVHKLRGPNACEDSPGKGLPGLLRKNPADFPCHTVPVCFSLRVHVVRIGGSHKLAFPIHADAEPLLH